MNRLYQWLTERASALFSAKSPAETGRVVRTEIRVHKESTITVLGGVLLPTEPCPLCGQKLDFEPPKQERLQLQSQSESEPGRASGLEDSKPQVRDHKASA